MKLNKTQKKALKASIKHWKRDIVAWLEGGYKIVSNDIFRWNWCDGEEAKITGIDCACCEAFFCATCPLHKAGDNCNRSRSTYDYFINDPTLTNARKMVAAMEKILKEGA